MLGYAAAADIADTVHRAMIELDRFCDAITLTNGSIATLDYAIPIQMPVWVIYEDVGILRKVARYRLGLHYAWVTT